MSVQRYFIYLAYDGTNYHGWQIQPNGISVQECLMKALSTFLRRDIEVIGAGRTDAGVHASLMVAHFDYEELLDTDSVTDKLNRLLPRIFPFIGFAVSDRTLMHALTQLPERTSIM